MSAKKRSRSIVISAILLWTCSAGAHAGTVVFSGTLDPATDSNLTYWDQLANSYSGAIAGPTDADRAFNIAIHTFIVSTPGVVNFSSLGYGMGGFDAVLSVFEGTGNSAAYITHGFNPIIPGDFNFDVNLGADTYTLA